MMAAAAALNFCQANPIRADVTRQLGLRCAHEITPSRARSSRTAPQAQLGAAPADQLAASTRPRASPRVPYLLIIRATSATPMKAGARVRAATA